MMEALVALALFSVFGQTLSFQCPRSNVRGLFADPEDCSKYYQCVNGGRYYPKNCPPGLWFDSRYSICNWPGYVSCNTRRPEIQPLASEESDPVLTGTIRRYPQKLGRQVHTTRKRSTYHTKPTTYPVPKRTTTTTTMKMIPESTTHWTSMVPEFNTRAPLAPQAERTAQHLQGTTIDPSPGPISSSQSVLDWLYQDNVLYDDDESQVENAHPQAPPKSSAQSNPINSVASLDEYGGFEDDAEYQDTGFEPPPECSAAFSLQLDPTRCEGFYQCYLWIPYPKVCPAGLLFDHQSNVCNWPEYVYCLNGERYDPPETTTMEEIVTMPPNPPAPSNNFNPQGNGGFREDNNYDDYWPIEGVMEGQHHQTAFKKKVLPVDSSQISDETYEKRSTPKIKATTLMMYTDSMATMDECGSDGCYSSKKVKTSDYKIQPIMTKNEPVSTTATTTISPATIAVRLAKLRDSESKSLSDSLESSSQSDSTSSETRSNESSFSSSKEEHNSAESLHSSAEDNEIVKPELTSNKFKIKENEIEVEIVEVKISDGESKVHQDEFGARNATSTKKTTPTQKLTSAPTVTPTKSAEENSSNTISSEDSDETENYSSVQFGDNSTESSEGSGSAPVLSKIDTLRNSVEKLITDETPTPPVKNNNLTKSAAPTTEKADLFANATAAPNATTVTAAQTTVLALNTTPNEKASVAPRNANDSIDVPQSVNTTENVTALDTNEKLDSNITYVNVSVAADVEVEKSVNDKQKNTSNPDFISLKNQTENSTPETIVPDKNITVTNATVGNDTTFGLNVSVEETSSELQLNSTDNVTQATTLNQTSTEPELLTTTTQSPSSSIIPLTTKCSDSNCKTATSKSTTRKAQSATHISRTSGHSARKAKARRPGIVMLSGKSPIARILEKLLNIRMKQIGNNKFKAIEATKQSVKDSEVPSENKIKSSPKSQNDEARTANPKATFTTDAKTSVYASKVTTRKSSKAPVTSTTKPTTKATVEGNDNTTKQSATGAENSTISLESDVNDLENTSMSVMNTTDLPGNATSNSSDSFKPSTQSESNFTEKITEMTTSEFSNSSNQTTTMKTTTITTETTVLTTINSEMKNVSVAVAENTQKETKKEDTNTTAALKLTTESTVTTTTGKTIPQSLSTPKLENSTTDYNITRPVPNTNETSNSSVKADDIYIAKMDLNTTDIVLNTTGTSNTSISTNESASTTAIPISGNTTKEAAGVNKTITIGTIEKATTKNLVSFGNNSSSIENATTIEVSSNATSSLVTSTPTTTSTSTTTTTTTAKAASTEGTFTNTTTTLPTTAPKTSKKQRRETHKPARKPTHFRQRANAPHFEARKVFGGPDEKWRFSDGTLVDQFSRQQRDVDMMNEMSSAYHLTPSLVLITVVLFLCNQLA